MTIFKPMTARDLENELLTRCVSVRDTSLVAQDQREANVFCLTARVLKSQHPLEATQLMLASEQYFSTHPDEVLSSDEVLKKNWIIGLPRFRDLLSRKFNE